MSHYAPGECGPFVCAFPDPQFYEPGSQWTCPNCGTTYELSDPTPRRGTGMYAPHGAWRLPEPRVSRRGRWLATFGTILAALGALMAVWPFLASRISFLESMVTQGMSGLGMSIAVLGMTLFIMGATIQSSDATRAINARQRRYRS